MPSPAAHPLCSLVTYVLRLDDGRWLPFPRFMEPGDLREMLALDDPLNDALSANVAVRSGFM